MTWLPVRTIANTVYMMKYCMLKPITHCNAGLTLGIVFSVNMGVGPAPEPKVSI